MLVEGCGSAEKIGQAASTTLVEVGGTGFEEVGSTAVAVGVDVVVVRVPVADALAPSQTGM